ncbi:MAG: sensor domain-containing diguanylate cyclase [Gammaproteobacteria bacterium]|nr:sensor domain-containing diguanylate cyclase [Gammaproteobacteria bacterium]
MAGTEILEEQQELRRKLQLFMEQARENEQKMRRFHEQELNLISARTLPDLIQNILYNYRRAFSLDAVTLVIYDPEYEIRRILEEEGVRMSDHPSLLFVTQREKLISLFGKTPEPKLGSYQKDQHQFLFNQLSQGYMPLRSVALLPLLRYGDLIGSFNLGSFTEERFAEASGTEFLQRLATIVAICIENAANNERLKRIGLTDPLTRINNRRFFDQRLSEEIGRSVRANESISCLFIDIDHFKAINDDNGHQQGDFVLREVARLIRDQLRNCDVLARYGGEEFSVLLANTPEQIAWDVAERIRTRIERHAFDLPETGKTIHVSVSTGIATLADLQGQEDISKLGRALIENADHALYDAKSNGRNCVKSYNPNMHHTNDQTKPADSIPLRSLR